MVEKNEILQILELKNCGMGDAGFLAFSKGLSKNYGIEVLNIS